MAKGTQRVSETEMEMEYVLYVHKHVYIHHRNWRREGALGFPRASIGVSDSLLHSPRMPVNCCTQI
jgi:hypothetical protein